MKENSLERGRGRCIMGGAMLALLLAALDNTIVSTAMASVAQDFGDSRGYSWPFTAYLLFATAAVPIAGKLSDRFGRKPLVLIGLLVFLFASVGCGLSWSMASLTAWRALAGFGGGALSALAFIVVATGFPPAERGGRVGLLASMYGVASLAGPLAGGAITQSLSWRWAFLANIPIALAAMVLVARGMGKEGRRAGSPLDIRGLLFFSLGALPFVFYFSAAGSLFPWLSWAGSGLLVAAALFLAAFVHAEGRAEDPLVPKILFAEPNFAFSALAAAAAYAGLFSAVVFVPRIAQADLGYSPSQAGGLLLPLTVAMMLGGNLGGRVAGRFGKWRIVGGIGLGSSAAGFALMALASMCSKGGSEAWLLGLAEGAAGLGLGLSLPVYNMASQFSLPLGRIGIVTAMLEFFQDLGGTVGSGFAGALFKSGPSFFPGLSAARSGSAAVFLLSALLSLAGAFLLSRIDESKVRAGMEAQAMPRPQR